MNCRILKEKFETYKADAVKSAHLLRFNGVDGYDVYNTTIPFEYNKKRYMYGRVEKREEWASSYVRLFEETGEDEWSLVRDSMIYQLEDPFVSVIHGEYILGGTHVRKKQGAVDTYYCYFYRGTPDKMTYFTTGPEHMKDIRLLELSDGRVGVFSRPRGEVYKNGAASMIGFTVIDNIDELCAGVIEGARYIDGIFGNGEWGGVNQAFELDRGEIACVSHMCYTGSDPQDGHRLSVYTNASFVFNPETFGVRDFRIIGTKSAYPEAPAKKPHLTDCTFTSGIIRRGDGFAELYGGIGDTAEGRIVIEDPFK